MMKNRNFQLWLRWSGLFVIIHAVILLIVFGTNVPVIEKVLFFKGSGGGPDFWLPLPFAVSRWFDLLVFPSFFGIMIVSLSRWEYLEDFITGFVITCLAAGVIACFRCGLLVDIMAIIGIATITGWHVGLINGCLVAGFGTYLITGLAVCSIIGFAFGLGIVGSAAALIISLVWILKKVFSWGFWRVAGKTFANFMMVDG